MAKFEVLVYELDIKEHPNADMLEIAYIGEFKSCVQKGKYKTGDLGVYIPEGSIVPENVTDVIGVTGKLAGSSHDRVKAVKLRGIVSQGLIFPIINGGSLCVSDKSIHVAIGDDVSEFMGIVKYEPPIPQCLAGEVYPAFGCTIKYDIENFKKYPNCLIAKEEVVITEKLHGTWSCFAHHPDLPLPIVSSKGLSANGLVLKLNDDNANNTYCRMLNSTADQYGRTVIDRLRDMLLDCDFFNVGWGTPVYIIGETFGKGIQDLHYGLDHPEFRVFDIYIGDPGMGRYLDYSDLVLACEQLNVEMVPLLYRGEFSKEILEELTEGKKSIIGNSTIREGVVVKPVIERTDSLLGRVILKNVSSDYLLRKGDTTEYN